MGAAQLANAGNARIEPYATGLFNAWGIGDKSRNDGVLILIWPERREMRIALGGGYGPSWEGVARRVVDSDFLPGFRAGRMADGIETGVGATIERIARPFVGKPSPPVGRSSGGGLLAAFVATIMGMVGVAGAAIVGMRFGRVACPKCGQMNTVTRSSNLPMAPFVSGHIRLDEFKCTKCGHAWQTRKEVYDRDDHDNPGGGDYSSFGGGSSAGRGASGRW